MRVNGVGQRGRAARYAKLSESRNRGQPEPSGVGNAYRACPRSECLVNRVRGWPCEVPLVKEGPK